MKHSWRSKHSHPHLNKGHYKKQSFKTRHWGLRRRLTFMFAFVALAAVTLTTWLTLGAVFSAQRDLFDLQLHSQNSISSDMAPSDQKDSLFRKGFSPFSFGHGKSGNSGNGNNFASDPNFESVAKAFRQITRTAFLAALLSFFLASAAAAALTRFLTRPLLALTDGAKRLETGERNVQLPVPSSQDELRSLTEAFNNMSAGLERQETWRRNMVADVAHDLRTPLAVLRSEIEAMQDGITQTDAEGLERLHNEVMTMADLVSDLKTLSIAESGVLELQKEDVNINKLLIDTVEVFSRPAQEVKSTIEVKETIDSIVKLDLEQIQRVFRNLIDNALSYASPCNIELAAQEGVSDDKSGIVLTIRDTGPGIAEDGLEQVFERFYRGDTARTKESRTTEGGKRGSGLGLNIAKAITEAHGGWIQAYNHPDGGAVFEIWLPLIEEV